MKIFIVSKIFENNGKYNDEVINEMCEAIRYQYSDNHNSKDESIEIYTLGTFSELPPITKIQRALNYLDYVDKIIFVSGYASSKICGIIYYIAHEYLGNLTYWKIIRIRKLERYLFHNHLQEYLKKRQQRRDWKQKKHLDIIIKMKIFNLSIILKRLRQKILNLNDYGIWVSQLQH